MQYIVFESLARPNANILLPRPDSPHYDARAIYSGLEIRKLDLLLDREWEIDLEGIESIADENTVAMVVGARLGFMPANGYAIEFSKKIRGEAESNPEFRRTGKEIKEKAEEF
ncbi:unnamed protein product [Arabis nemorensis]|uniref:Uncharacterized protein n=1 Tax=Arabis nemorensis TaxID=586526 RepID=A0A565BE60_9BRAS|nr:unnamed protein product [Arabis nemorensis]